MAEAQERVLYCNMPLRKYPLGLDHGCHKDRYLHYAIIQYDRCWDFKM